MHFLLTFLPFLKEQFNLRKEPAIVHCEITEKAHNRTRTGFHLINDSKKIKYGVNPGDILVVAPGEFREFCRKERINYNSVSSGRSQKPDKNIRCNNDFNYGYTGWTLLAKNATNLL